MRRWTATTNCCDGHFLNALDFYLSDPASPDLSCRAALFGHALCQRVGVKTRTMVADRYAV